MRNIWNVLGAIAGVLGVGVAVFVFFQGRSEQSKRLEVALISRSTLMNPMFSSGASGVELLYKGKKIADYAILQLRMTNIGGQPIRAADYEVPITINFDNVAEILWAEQVDADPAGLHVAKQIKDYSVELSSVLLNPSDWFIVEVGVVPLSGQKVSAAPLGRIAGVKRIEFRESAPPSSPESTRFPTWLKYTSGVTAVLLVLSMGVQFWMRRNWYSVEEMPITKF